MSLRRLLAVNADDFGFTRDVNAGIVEAHRGGILTSATLMANGAAFDDAVRLARENPTLDVGCHLVLIGGNAVAPPHQPLPASLPALVEALLRGRIRPGEELAAQVRKIVEAGIAPTHADTHKHTHLLPPVIKAVARVCEEFRIPWVRRPFPVPLARGYHGRILRRHGRRTTDHFAGFRMTGRFGTADLVRLIRSLPEGSTEFMCHPGYSTAELRAAPTRLKESRERELAALTAAETKRAVQEAGVTLLGFGDLGAAFDRNPHLLP